MSTSNRSVWRLWIPKILSFLLPMLLLFVQYAFLGVYPFGEKSVLTIDLNSQYVNFFAAFREMILGGEGIFYSFRAGMGLNFFGLFAYYLASPFSILTLLFPASHLTEAIWLMILLKIGCSGLTFYLFVSSKFKSGGLLAAAFSVCYALCSYNIVYASNLMWLDGVLLLPLVLLGIEKLIGEKKPLLLLTSLFVLFVADYYIAYMVGVFSFFYFVCVTLPQFDLRTCLKKFLQFAGCAVLAAGCAAFILLPAFFALKNGQLSMGTSFPKLVSNFSPLEFLTRLTNGSYDTLVTEGLPNLYPSMLAVAAFLLYFFCGDISRRERMLFLSLTFFLVLSMVLSPLDFIWHAFKSPTWFPYRYSFVFSFLLIFLAYQAVLKLQSVSFAALCTVFAVEIAVFSLLLLKDDYRRQVIISLTFLLLFALLILLIKWNEKPHILLCITLLLLVCADQSLNANTLLKRIDKEFGYRSRASYTDFVSQKKSVIEPLLPKENEFYRIEKISTRCENDPLSVSFPGISHYSTTSNQRLNWFLKNTGFRYGTKNAIVYARSPLITNSFLGIRYVVSDQSLIPEGYLPVEGQSTVYENPCVLPLAFAAPVNQPEQEPVAPDTYNAHDNFFELQNQYLNRLFGKEDQAYFKQLEIGAIDSENLEWNQQKKYLRLSKTSGEDGVLRITVPNPDRLAVYVSMPVYAYQYGSADLYVNGKHLKRHLYYMNSESVYLGNDEVIDFEIRLHSNTVTVESISFCGTDLPLFAKDAEEAQKNALSLSRFSSSEIEGTISVEEQKTLVTTIPFDKGWSAYVDGKKAPLSRYLGVFTQLSLSPGEHTVVFRFTPYGFLPGVILSVLSFALLLGLGIKKHLSQRKK